MKTGISWSVAALMAVSAGALARADTPVPGALELTLDRVAVTALVRAGIPAPKVYAIPGLGQVTLALEPPKTVNFREGGLEAVVPLRIVELGLAGNVALRYEPRIDKENGNVMLAPASGRLDGALSGLPDIAPLLPDIAVPRAWDGQIHPPGGVRTEVNVRVHSVEINDEHLLVRLGLNTRRLD